MDCFFPMDFPASGKSSRQDFSNSVSLITGTLPAQYGNRTAGIIDMHTKSGADLNGAVVTLYGGGFGTVTPTIEYGGNSGPYSGYGIFSYQHNSIGMANPNPSYQPTHDNTDQFKGFANLSYLIDDTSRLSLNSKRRTEFLPDSDRGWADAAIPVWSDYRFRFFHN